MKSVQTIVSRIKTPPKDRTFLRKLWLVLGAFFALAFVYEVVQWSGSRGEPSQLALTAGFLSISAFSLSGGGWMRVVFFTCGMALLMICLVMRVFHLA